MNFWRNMKKHFGLILMLVLAALVLGGCAMGPRADGTPGVSADETAAYVSYQQFVYKIDAATGTEVWRYPQNASAQIAFYAPPLLADGKLYVGDLANRFQRLSIENGSVDWIFSEAKGWFEAKAATDGTYIIAPNLDRNVYCLTVDGTLAWTYSSEFGFLAEPIVVEDKVYISSMDHHLVALDIATGDIIWKTKLNGALVSAPYYDAENGALYVGSMGKELTAVDSQSGEILWAFNNNGELSSVWATPVMFDGSVVFSDESGKIFGLNPADGSVNWALDAGGSVTAGILPLESSFVIVREDGTLTVYNMSDRAPVWTRTIEGQVYSTPILAGDKIFIGVKGSVLLQAFDLNGNLVWSFTPGK